METKTIEKTADAAINLAHLTHEISKAKALVGDLVEDGKRKAERTAKRAYVAAEDCIEDTTFYIKRHPWQSVGIAAGFGLSAGIVASWMLSRNSQACTRNAKTEFQAVER